jgi:fluoroquinolone transport system permease protein
VALATVGLSFNLVLFSVGVIFTSTLMLSIGMFAVMPYSSISAFLLPSQLYFLPICVPLIDFSGWVQSPLIYLIPSQASLLLLKGAFFSIHTSQLVYAIVYQAIWIIVLFRLSERRFRNYVIAGGALSERRKK